MEPPDFDVPEDDEAELAAIAEAFVALRDVAYRYAQTGKLPDDLPDELVPLITQFSRVLTGELTLGDLTPSEEELNEDPELEAWWAGVGPPPAQTLTAARMQTAAPLIAPPRTGARPREHRARRTRRFRSRSGSRGDPPDDPDDPDDVEDRARRGWSP